MNLNVPRVCTIRTTDSTRTITLNIFVIINVQFSCNLMKCGHYMLPRNWLQYFLQALSLSARNCPTNTDTRDSAASQRIVQELVSRNSGELK